MSGQMCWLPIQQPDGEKVLHLRTHLRQPWQPYTACLEYAVPDYRIVEGSKGWATYQKLRRSGWILAPSPQSQASSSARQVSGMFSRSLKRYG